MAKAKKSLQSNKNNLKIYINNNTPKVQENIY